MAKNVFIAIHEVLHSKKPTSENARHARRTWKKAGQRRWSFSKTVLWITLLFLFVPLFVIIIYSFNDSKGAEFTEFSMRWYKELFINSNALWQALLNSLIVALSSALVSTLLGTIASIGLNWYKFKGKKFIQTLTYLPMVLPEVIIGISMVITIISVAGIAWLTRSTSQEAKLKTKTTKEENYVGGTN